MNILMSILFVGLTLIIAVKASSPKTARSPMTGNASL
jgi:hypothetical protein